MSRQSPQATCPQRAPSAPRATPATSLSSAVLRPERGVGGDRENQGRVWRARRAAARVLERGASGGLRGRVAAAAKPPLRPLPASRSAIPAGGGSQASLGSSSEASIHRRTPGPRPQELLAGSKRSAWPAWRMNATPAAGLSPETRSCRHLPCWHLLRPVRLPPTLPATSVLDAPFHFAFLFCFCFLFFSFCS